MKTDCRSSQPSTVPERTTSRSFFFFFSRPAHATPRDRSPDTVHDLMSGLTTPVQISPRKRWLEDERIYVDSVSNDVEIFLEKFLFFANFSFVFAIRNEKRIYYIRGNRIFSFFSSNEYININLVRTSTR